MGLWEIFATLLLIQAAMGACDTLYHHELRCALPQQPHARRELWLHALRSSLYGIVFIGLAWWNWGGWTLALLWAIQLTEIILTLTDFVEEDRIRQLPPSERILHTILTLNAGVLYGMMASLSWQWWQLPTGWHFVSRGTQAWLSITLTIIGILTLLSAARDGLASREIRRRQQHKATFDFGPPGQSFLITGGTGFIGQKLVAALLQQGHAVTLLTRQPVTAAIRFQGRVECVSSFQQLNTARHFDIVINLAGERILGPRWTRKRRQKLLDSRVKTTRKLIHWLTQATTRPYLLISGSAIGYYGIQDKNDAEVLDESAPDQPIFMSQLCVEWEQAAAQATTLGLPLAILRLGVVLGHQGALPAMLLPVRFGMGGPMGDGRQTMGWIHIEDVIDIIAWLCRTPTDEPLRTYNAVAPQLYNQRQWIQAAAQVLHRPAFFPTPALPMRLLLGEQSDLLLEGQRVAPARLQREGYRFRFPDISAALTQLLDKDET